MKTNKKLAAILSAALAVSAPVVADDVMLIATNPAEEAELISDVASVEEISQWNTIMGEVTEVIDGMVVVKSEETEIALKASEETIVIDQATGFPSDISALEVGNIISAQYGPAMTMSLPAQTVADIIVVNADQGSLANLIVADKVSANEDGTVTVFDETKQIELTISAEAEVSPYKTRNIITLSDIKEGDKLVAWYDMVTMSIPAQAYTEKVVVAAAPVLVEEVTSITVNGEAVEGEVVYSGDNVMVPVRSVAEALGFEVIWNDADFSVTLVKGDISATVKIGEEGITSGKARSAEAFAAPELINDKTYVAENLFTKLLGEGTVETNNGVINFVAE